MLYVLQKGIDPRPYSDRHKTVLRCFTIKTAVNILSGRTAAVSAVQAHDPP